MITRFIDLVLSLFGLIILLPVLICTSLILKIRNEPIFFTQTRIGFNNTKFKVIKFTTMISDSSKIGLRNITVRDDPRVTTFGKFLRSSKINELPQLFNVLFGEMSIVGPRPLPPKSFIKYSKEGQLVVSKSKPGITGISSVIFRDEEAFATLWQNNNLDVEFMYKTELYPYKEELEQWFFSHKSLKTYFLLIFLTCYAVFFNPRKILNSIFKDLPKSNLFNP